MLGIAKDPLQHTSMYERMEEGINKEMNILHLILKKYFTNLIQFS